MSGRETHTKSKVKLVSSKVTSTFCAIYNRIYSEEGTKSIFYYATVHTVL